MKKMFDGWKEQKKFISIDMQGTELEDYFRYLGNELHVPFKGGLEQKRRLQYIAYFSKVLSAWRRLKYNPRKQLLYWSGSPMYSILLLPALMI